MQVGIDIGATKIESVILKKNGEELGRYRIPCSKNYNKIIDDISEIVFYLDKKYSRKFKVGVCHPGSIDYKTGLLKNSINAKQLNNKRLNVDLSKALKRKVICENDANCFALSEAIDGAAKKHSIVFGIIIGSGTGGGVVINKQILKGSNYLTGEWGHLPLPIFGKLNDKKFIKKKISMMQVQKFTSGKGLEKLYHKKITAREIFDRSDKFTKSVFLKHFKIRLARALVNLIYTIDPDIFVFGGGLSNEIKSLKEIKNLVMKNMELKNLNTKFVKAKYGDASGVRGAARLGSLVKY
jgi:fructokinase